MPVESFHQGFIQNVSRECNWQNETEEQHQRNVISKQMLIKLVSRCKCKFVSRLLVLEPQNRIGREVSHINAFAILDDVRMLLAHQPAHVGEEEAATGIVWIRVGIRILVMDPMVSDPFYD